MIHLYKWYTQRQFQLGQFDLMCMNDYGNGRIAIGLPAEMVFKEQDRDSMIEVERPTLRMPEGSAQSLLQALWDAGLRPNSGEGVSAHVDALKHSIYFAEGIVNKLMAVPPATAMTTLQSSPDTFEDLRQGILKADERVRVLEGQIRMLGVNPI